MFIKTVSEIIEEKLVNSNCMYIPVINFSETLVQEIIRKCKDTSSLVDIVNKINQQGITEISFQTFIVTKGAEQYGMSDLSTAERLFVLAYAADKIRQKVIFSCEVFELSLETLKLFFKLFADSEFINIAALDLEYQYYLEDIRSEVKCS